MHPNGLSTPWSHCTPYIRRDCYVYSPSIQCIVYNGKVLGRHTVQIIARLFDLANAVCTFKSLGYQKQEKTLKRAMVESTETVPLHSRADNVRSIHANTQTSCMVIRKFTSWRGRWVVRVKICAH